MKKISLYPFRKLVGKLGLSESETLDILIFSFCKKNWKQLVGDILAANTQVVSVEKKNIRIHASHSAYISEVMFLKSRILNIVSASFEAQGLSLDAKLGAFSHAPTEQKSKLKPENSTNTMKSIDAKDLKKIESVLSKVENEKLKSKLETLYKNL